MDKELFSLAVQGVRRKRRSSGLVVLVLLVSFGFALMSLSVLGSIQATNASYRQNLYGSWYYALPNGQPQDAEFLSRWAGAKRWGQMQCYGTTRGGVSIGTIDEGLRELAGWSWCPAHGRPLCGRWPSRRTFWPRWGWKPSPAKRSTWISSSAAGARPWSSSAAIPSPA